MAVDPAQAEALGALILETRLLFRSLRAVADRVHGDQDTAARRSILLELVARGPKTAPALAHSRHVSRQAVQGQLDALEERGLAEKRPNPKHRRSPLWAASPAGTDRARAMLDRERAVLGGIADAPGVDALEGAAQVLARCRDLFDALDPSD